MSNTFKFTWGHPAEEVYVTGTFDNWTKSEKLEKVGDSFEKTVTLPDATEKIYYKFVVDNNWITDHTAPQEPDQEGNVNNFLTPEQITKSEPVAAAAVMSSVNPDSKDEPKATPTDAPGGFPATPAEELENKTVSIDPIPASDVTQPSVVVAPGDPLPPTAKAGDVNAAVTLDKESYEKSDRLPGLTDENSKLPAATSDTIPESSLPTAALAAATINTVSPESTTVALAAEVPKETIEVPEAVKESQEKAGVAPGASADPEEVLEKTAVEDELKEKVPEAPSTAEGTSGFGTEKSEQAGIAATAVTAGGIALSAAVAAKDALIGKAEPAAEEATEQAKDTANQASETATEATNQATTSATSAAQNLPEGVKESLPASAQGAIKDQAQEETRQEVAPNAPPEVKESITEAAKAPEAAGSAAAVDDKKVVEDELLKEVKPVPAIDEEKTKTSEVKEDAKAASKGEAVDTPKEALAADSKKDESKKEETNGSGAAAATSSKDNDSAKQAESTTDKKKRNRLSAFIGKVKNKLKD